MNTLTLTGRLASEPTVRQTINGKAYTTFTIAHTERKQVNGEWTDGTTLWLDCICWSGSDQISGYAKGSPVIATGKLDAHTYTDKNGQKVSKVQLNVANIGIDANVPKPKKQPQALPVDLPEQPQAPVSVWSGTNNDVVEDLPF